MDLRFPFVAETKNAPWTQQTTPTVRYQYNGKEKIDELGLGWNDYGARNYDALLGRWMGVDELAEEQVSFTPYHYVYDNPMLLTDPDGRNPILGAMALGAISGALWEYGSQVAGNLYNGRGAESFTNVDSKEIVKSAAIGAALGGVGKAIGLSAKMFSKAADKVDDIVAIEKRAKDIQNVQTSQKARNLSTTAVAEVEKNGVKERIVASSRNRLTPTQRKALQKGESEVAGKGHAEETIINYANKNGMKVEKIAASRPVCTNCQEVIKTTGAKIESKLKAPKK